MLGAAQKHRHRGPDKMDTLAYWTISLLFVIALILGLALLLKKIFLPHTANTPLFKKPSKRRLQLVEILAIDHKSRLLLVRRDHVEHLILQGQTGETLIESGITPPLHNNQPPPKETLQSETGDYLNREHKEATSADHSNFDSTDGGD